MKVIALDYDGTYTDNPVLWDQFILNAQSHRYHVVIVTMRYETERIPHPIMVDVYYTNRKAKKPFMLALGVNPAIWIDDTPEALLMDFK